ETPGEYENVLNCQDDAFRTAVSTLHRLVERHGAASAPAKSWVRAQDQVFSNCSGRDISITEPADDPERAYQVAAAKFYAGKLDDAQHDFEAIARDRNSPWKTAAPYLVARCLLRKKAYLEAAEQLDRVIADPALAEWHGPARRLAGFVRRKAAPG